MATINLYVNDLFTILKTHNTFALLADAVVVGGKNTNNGIKGKIYRIFFNLLTILILGNSLGKGFE
jgi:hypothetical protein